MFPNFYLDITPNPHLYKTNSTTNIPYFYGRCFTKMSLLFQGFCNEEQQMKLTANFVPWAKFHITLTVLWTQNYTKVNLKVSGREGGGHLVSELWWAEDAYVVRSFQ
jgi:hypothetical protein